MKAFFRNLSFAIISVILIFFIFFGGFFAGKGRAANNAPNDLSGADTPQIEADFSPFWEVWNILDDRHIPASVEDVATDQERVWGAISGMVDSLEDPYTEFLPPAANEDFRTAINGEFSGVGMEVGIQDDIITVVAPLKNTPAERAGVKTGDQIVSIDGISTIGMSLDEAVNLIRGEIGTVVEITVIREGEADPLNIEIIRDIINIPTLDFETRDDVFILSLYNFSANSPDEFRNALREFVKSRRTKLILDLRGNPGGFLEASVDIASWFLPAGKIIVSEDFGDGEVKHFRSRGYDIFDDDFEMIVLVNGGSASASEILAGALREHGVARIVGTQTFGKGSVQELVRVTNDTSLKVTIAQWLTPDGNSISDGGLTPAVIVDEAPGEEDLFEHQIREAIKLLR